MKKITALVILLIFLSRPPILLADTQEEIIQRVNSDTSISDGLINKLESTQDPEGILAILEAEAPKIRAHYNESSNFYLEKINLETDENLRSILKKINAGVNGLSGSLLSLESSIESGNTDEFTNSLNRYDGYILQLNEAIKELNSYYGVFDYKPWLATSFWVTLIISVVLFLMSRGSPLLPAEKLRNKFEFALFKSSLWPLAGSAISYFWLLATSPGGTFYLLWGPIVFGFFQFLRGLYSYIRYARPAINIAKKEEQKKLEALLSSETFQKENIREKLKAIEKLKPVIKLGEDE